MNRFPVAVVFLLGALAPGHHIQSNTIRRMLDSESWRRGLAGGWR